MNIHCRTGSSENGDQVRSLRFDVHCRTGSSETLKFAWLVNKINTLAVRCKDGTGSRDPTP